MGLSTFNHLFLVLLSHLPFQSLHNNQEIIRFDLALHPAYLGALRQDGFVGIHEGDDQDLGHQEDQFLHREESELVGVTKVFFCY